jgi:hypothetical protein
MTAMSETRTTTFRLPSKYIVFLESLANDAGSDRTKELIAILDWAMQIYLKKPDQFTKALTQLKRSQSLEI